MATGQLIREVFIAFTCRSLLLALVIRDEGMVWLVFACHVSRAGTHIVGSLRVQKLCLFIDVYQWLCKERIMSGKAICLEGGFVFH
jgi:hypothetical protein